MARSLVLLVAVFAVAVVIMSAAVSAQVNFSPSWGKRTPPSVVVQQDDLQQIQESCKMPYESMFRIQKLIQAEAQRLLRCQSFSVDSVQRRK